MYALVFTNTTITIARKHIRYIYLSLISNKTAVTTKLSSCGIPGTRAVCLNNRFTADKMTAKQTTYRSNFETLNTVRKTIYERVSSAVVQKMTNTWEFQPLLSGFKTNGIIIQK